MTQIPGSLVDFARQLLSHDLGNGSINDVASAMERWCRALHSRLAPVIGSAAFDALIGRAVKLAARNFAFLNDSSMGANCSADELRQALEGREQEEVTNAAVAILANFLWLLVIFIGENLGLRMVHEIWPDVPFKAPGSSTEEVQP